MNPVYFPKSSLTLPIGCVTPLTCTWLREHEDDARILGRAGREVARAVTWDACIERLLAAVV